MEKGKENIAKREKIIADCETKIKDLSIRLDDLIRRLMEAKIKLKGLEYGNEMSN